MMKYLPIFLDIDKKPCLVVGGGEVANRKVQQLLKAKARVTVIAPRLCPQLMDLFEKNTIDYIADRFYPSSLIQVTLVIAATNDTDVNRQISALAMQRGILVNVVDVKHLCSFIMPSVIDRNPLQIAISTGGASPVLARYLRAKLETVIPASYGKLAKLFSKFRNDARVRYPDIQNRRRFWENVMQSPIVEMVYAGQSKTASEALKLQLEEKAKDVKQGEVYLVGAGPGDPDLLTFRALRLMQQAEVVLYDRLVALTIVDLVRRDAERVYVGKSRDQHALSQEKINALLVKLAKQGKRVLRLKGGDPFIFGRGGEEIASLSSEGICFQIVPGITAASACACYAGIPLTHRDYAHSCIFTTGHLKDGSMDMNWDALIQPKQTIVVYMGLMGVTQLSAELIRRGMLATTPIALVQQGSTQKQRVYISDLQSLPNIPERYSIKPPTMIIIGEVVNLHEKLAWFEPQKLNDDRS